MANFLILHGPNLNMLGRRDCGNHSSTTLAQINQQMYELAKSYNHHLVIEQSNAEHELINCIQQTEADLIIINAAGYSYTSIALRDTLLARNLPTIEVHLHNTAHQTSSYQGSLISDVAIGTIQGFGALSYSLAIQAAHHHCLNNHCQQEETVDGYS